MSKSNKQLQPHAIDLVVIAHNIRSAHNVGSLLRTCDGLGVSTVYLTGYTPYPRETHDDRLPHIADKITAQIDKTALNATEFVSWKHDSDCASIIQQLKSAGYYMCGLEQTPHSQQLHALTKFPKIALILGSEETGIDEEVQALCDGFVEIPMFGRKESFNVVQAAAMALYHLRFVS